MAWRFRILTRNISFHQTLIGVWPLFEEEVPDIKGAPQGICHQSSPGSQGAHQVDSNEPLWSMKTP